MFEKLTKKCIETSDVILKFKGKNCKLYADAMMILTSTMLDSIKINRDEKTITSEIVMGVFKKNKMDENYSIPNGFEHHILKYLHIIEVIYESMNEEQDKG